ncbi:tetratricopeptide repeat protein [Nitrosomonas sp.]|uniref:tetratricopeptide repeat protein n=1 Tax=Nitrosomonas sp. TaxID=42353 RepID=UPI0025F42D4A|nr:tetratricopeptide repeat protein [Nitrosomonas sp.]
MRHWGAQGGKLKHSTRKLLQAAYQLSPDDTRAFIARSAVDFAEDETAWQWWRYLSENAPADTVAFYEMAFSVTGQLCLRGKYNIAKERWLSQLCESEDPQLRARALNLHGLMNIHLSNFETALDYLKKSLAIQQEIGDKAGLCATLFNIGHIHLQNGEVPDALKAWITVYGIAKKIHLAQALQALESLADNLGLPGGLDGWETLAGKLDKPGPPDQP